MKKNILLYIASLSALLTVSCAREVFPETTGKGFADGETGLVMQVRSVAPGTRLLEPIADEDLNEYRLEQFYYFIYKVDPSKNATAIPVHVGKWTAPAGEPTINKGTEEKIPLDKYTDLKIDDNTYSGYVYVIANYKDAQILAAWDAAIKNKTYTTMTWDYFQNLSLPRTFDTYQMAPESEKMNETQDKLHRFKPQDSFVMASIPTSFTVTKGTVGKIDAGLKRLAVKISLEIHMAKWYVQKDNGKYKYTWYSDPARTQVYLSFAAGKGVMSGTPTTYISTGEGANAGDFFNYSRFAFIADWESKTTDSQTGVVSYTFPDGAYDDELPLQWHKKNNPAETQPETDGEYYTNDEDLVGKLVLDDEGKIVTKKFNHPAYKITGTPFYSYPYNFTNNSDYAPFFKIIAEWTAMDEPAASRATDTQAGSGGEPKEISKEFYYKITIPEVKVFQANNWYKIRLNLSTLGSETDEGAIDVSSDTYFVADWSSPESPAKPDINAGRYLNVTSKEKSADKSLLFKMYGDKLEIPVISSHKIEVTNVTSTYTNFFTGDAASLTYTSGEEASATGNNFKIEIAEDGKSSVTLSHTTVKDLNAMQAKDVGIITYTFTIKHTGDDGDSYKENITVEQIPSLAIRAQRNSDMGAVDSYGHTDQDGYTWVNGDRLGRGTNRGNTNFNMYIISVSVLPTTGDFANYKICDPRAEQYTARPGNAEATYYIDGNSVEGGSRRLQYYYPAGNTELYDNFIAPKFRVASSFGASSAMSRDNGIRRCASYQEDGYPAGRWRLPTVAEIKFMAQLTSLNLIPRLLGDTGTGETYYWCNTDNSAVRIDNAGRVGGVRDPEKVTRTQNSNVRCVYDEWYWENSTYETVTKTEFYWGDQPR